MHIIGLNFINKLIGRFNLRRQTKFLERVGFFDAEWYLNKYTDIRGDKIEALRHYIVHGRLEGRAATQEIWELGELTRQTFDARWYVDQNSEISEAVKNPIRHYVEHGFLAGCAPTRKVWELEKFVDQVFDRAWYGQINPDLSEGTDHLTHYIEYGFSEGRPPSLAAAEGAVFAQLGREHFDGDMYLSLNPDVLLAGADPIKHYVQYGHAENRPTRLGSHQPNLSLEANRDPLCWYYVGDTIEWLNHHSHLTGVGRVTSEILLSGLFEGDEVFLPCVKDHTATGLTRLIDRELISKIAQAAAYEITEGAGVDHSSAADKLGAFRPIRGDHVIFTGVVWNVSDALLIASLKELGVTVSVLVHDIIPITSPELVSISHARSFVHWLSMVVQNANVIFVSNAIVGQEISRWLLKKNLSPKISIQEIPFGVRDLRSDRALSDDLRKLIDQEFVLCVGTIDRRKNQRSLCEAWIDLYNGPDGGSLPQLVLIGRDDVGLALEPRFSGLVELKKIVFIDFATDADVAALYRACLFTVFPSISEGFGLPVVESFTYGKLCISSNLAVIRSHAGDLAWYFDPWSQQSLVAQLERALYRPAERLSAESQIRSEFRPTSWADTVRSIVETAEALMSQRFGVPLGQGNAVPVPHRFETPQVSFLIANKDSAAGVIQTVGWISANFNSIPHEIIVADNGSDVNDLETLSFIFPLVKFIRIGCDRFDGEAYNIAAEASHGSQLCIMSGVDQVPPEGLFAALELLQSGDSAKAVVSLSATLPGRAEWISREVGSAYNLERLDLGAVACSLSRSPTRGGKFFDLLLFDSAVFSQVNGFDLAFEPGPYEDVDLVMKVISAGCQVFNLDYAKQHNMSGVRLAAAFEEAQYINELNRRKVFDRWSGILNGIPLDPETSSEIVRSDLRPRGNSGSDRPIAILHTPYPLTPGGGELYLLSIASFLSSNYSVILAVPNLYSRFRLNNLAKELSLSLDCVEVRLLSDLKISTRPEIFISMDNFVVPRQGALGKKNLYICQFPFPMYGPVDAEKRSRIAGYDKYVAYSMYAKKHIETKLDSIQAPDVPVCLVSPPVAQIRPSAKRFNSILTVGRFFVGGHAKRHDLLIQAFKILKERYEEDVEFHIVGSTIPEKKHMDYVERLVDMGMGLPIHFHFNARPDILTELYASTEVYWHGAGLEADLTTEPWAAEHFGISVVEAMSAGAIPFALASGGPREIIEHGVNGFLYDSVETLVESTRSLLLRSAADRQNISQAAICRAGDFSSRVFASKIQELLSDCCG
ncbi:glycosyltransferase [Methylobacterium mesophilicum]|uniref:glycosyltransferase n=1 Tax=Methylobacterium mesophilicum TaxID=39956 RepID=UPI001EE1C104|nr:glycosyltransferase [Methylobacterium mesophilicum]